jgi:hypothetical protein
MEIRHKRGDVRKDGKVFWKYHESGNGYWLDAAKYEDKLVKNKTSLKKYYQDNREQTLEQKKKDYVINREIFLKRTKIYREANLEKISINYVIYQRNRLKADPLFRLTHNLRRRLSHAFKRQSVEKTETAFELTGCNREQLRNHLVSQFREGMTLENHGQVWHIDHIRPCASFDLSDKAQAAACFHYSNLQPLFAEENLAKSDSFNL